MVTNRDADKVSADHAPGQIPAHLADLPAGAEAVTTERPNNAYGAYDDAIPWDQDLEFGRGCLGVTKSGGACMAIALKDTQYCRAHKP